MQEKIYRLPKVIELTRLSRSSIYLALSKEEFPKPIKIGRRAIGWPEKSINEWRQKVDGGYFENLES